VSEKLYLHTLAFAKNKPGSIMTKFTAVILWPVVYILDALSWLLKFQTFKEARETSNKLFKRIMDRDKSFFEAEDRANSSILID
jgi:hypothetical protein